MKRWIRAQSSQELDEFDQAWEAKFGPEQQREFDSVEDFEKWLKEVDEFEVDSNQTI